MKLQHEDRYPLPVEDMFRVFTEKDFYEARYAGTDGRYEFVEFGPRGNTFVIDVKQHMKLRKGTALPAFAQRFVRDENILRTTIEWDMTGGSERRGVHRFRIDGVPVEVQGSMRMSPAADGCRNLIELNVTCSIPLIGGQIARMIAERAGASLKKNHDSTLRYLVARGLVPA
ncbi:MAG: DUF2505 domain-containing protein [Pseudomonadota bacterium]